MGTEWHYFENGNAQKFRENFFIIAVARKMGEKYFEVRNQTARERNSYEETSLARKVRR